MTSSNGNIFRVTGHLCGKFTGPRWISRTKASDSELWCPFDMRPNIRLSKQSWGWWFETPPKSLWRHRNAGDASHMFVEMSEFHWKLFHKEFNGIIFVSMMTRASLIFVRIISIKCLVNTLDLKGSLILTCFPLQCRPWGSAGGDGSLGSFRRPMQSSETGNADTGNLRQDSSNDMMW